MSHARQDEFYHCVERIAEQEDVRSVLILGADNKRYTTRALLAGISRNINEVAMFHLAIDETDDVRCGPAIERFKREKRIDSFDLALINLSEFSHLYRRAVDANSYCLEAKFVAIEGIAEISKYPDYGEFVRSSRYVPLVGDPALRNGYAVFERRAWVPLASNANKVHAAYSAPEVTGAGQ
jgi:hypothetical protein